MLDRILEVNKQIRAASSYSKEKSDKHGEVFTPSKLIVEMTEKLPKEIWRDPSKTFFDPCAGKGNFPIYIVARLWAGLERVIPDEHQRLKNIVEQQLFMGEFQAESAQFIAEKFKFGLDLKVNLYHGDTLTMPDDFFELDYDERRIKYPEHCA